MEPDFDDGIGRYKLCEIGFGLSALGLSLLCFDSACQIGLLFARVGGPPGLFQALLNLIHQPAWNWLVGSPIPWTTFVGSYLLFGRWSEPLWRRRAGLLVLMNFVDLLLWGVQHAGEVGLNLDRIGAGHEWLFSQITIGMGWVELVLFARLATEVSGHLGKENAPEAGRAAQSLALVGLVFWGMTVLTQTNWDRWPLAPRPWTPERFLLVIGASFVTALTSFQVTVLCMGVARQCKKYVGELRRHQGDELLISRSESEAWWNDRAE